MEIVLAINCSFRELSDCAQSSHVSSGCVDLDRILGGGFPIGKAVEIFGLAGS